MKDILQVSVFLISTVFILGSVLQAHAVSHGTTPETIPSETTLMCGDNLVGGWSYTVEGAPEGYEKGLLMIVKDGDGYQVQVQVAAGTLLGENIEVKGNTIDFEVMVDGDRVSVNLTAKGDAISGKSTSSEGSYSIKGEKTLSMG